MMVDELTSTPWCPRSASTRNYQTNVWGQLPRTAPPPLLPAGKRLTNTRRSGNKSLNLADAASRQAAALSLSRLTDHALLHTKPPCVTEGKGRHDRPLLPRPSPLHCCTASPGKSDIFTAGGGCQPAPKRGAGPMPDVSSATLSLASRHAFGPLPRYPR